MSHQATWEYVKAIHARYRQAPRPLTQRILDEFCQVSGYHRKYALRLLNGPPPGRPRPRARRREPLYGLRVIQVLAAIWAAAGYPWSVRLQAWFPLWLPWAARSAGSGGDAPAGRWQPPRLAGGARPAPDPGRRDR